MRIKAKIIFISVELIFFYYLFLTFTLYYDKITIYSNKHIILRCSSTYMKSNKQYTILASLYDKNKVLNEKIIKLGNHTNLYSTSNKSLQIKNIEKIANGSSCNQMHNNSTNYNNKKILLEGDKTNFKKSRADTHKNQAEIQTNLMSGKIQIMALRSSLMQLPASLTVVQTNTSRSIVQELYILSDEKQAEQSSTFQNSYAVFVVDVRTDTKGKLCATTIHSIANPWWRVDLGRRAVIANIQIVFDKKFNWCTGVCNYYIFVTMEKLEPSKIPAEMSCNGGNKIESVEKVANKQCQRNNVGRYVTIFLNSTEATLSLCKVQVFGYFEKLCDSNENKCDTSSSRCESDDEIHYKCKCQTGYINLEGDDKKCNYDKCAKGEHICSVTEICVNTSDGYKCKCKDGYRAVSKHCEDIDECKENIHNCDIEVQQCVNENGRHTCLCKQGYRKTETDCVDIDECENPSMCNKDEICINKLGSYLCIPKSLGSGKTPSVTTSKNFVMVATCIIVGGILLLATFIIVNIKKKKKL